jgi:hypothetical protein
MRHQECLRRDQDLLQIDSTLGKAGGGGGGGGGRDGEHNPLKSFFFWPLTSRGLILAPSP